MQELRRSMWTRGKKSYSNNFLTYSVEDEHVSYYDAIKFVDTPLWFEAFKKLLDYVESHLEWFEGPPKVKPIGC